MICSIICITPFLPVYDHMVSHMYSVCEVVFLPEMKGANFQFDLAIGKWIETPLPD